MALVESFVDNLTVLPLEPDIITEAVHIQSNTIDSRHFAEEFIRRRKLADRGIADPAPALPMPSTAASASTTGGWSEVAKKSPAAQQETQGNFKVVASKKRGGRR
jgi:PERQ amino acid-rich with GYF domain-containing protein